MIPSIQNSFVAGELSPSFLGRTDKPQYRNGASTMRNMFVRYQGGAYSRAGFAYCGMCKQAAPNAGGTATTNPPKLYNFQYSINQGFALEFGDQYMRILSNGAYVTESPQNVTNISQASPGVITILSNPFNNGDWVYGQNIGGATEFNNLTWIVQNSAASSFTLTDLFGNQANTGTYPAYTSGGTFSRLYTVVSPYAAVDLPYLKVVENANLMNLTCVNQATLTAYPPYTLTRTGNTSWAFTQVSFTSPISPPTGVAAVANPSTSVSTWYSYQVTAVDLVGNESIASSNADTLNNDISVNAGSNVINWSSSGTNITNYNIYSATPIFVSSSVSTDPGFTGVPYGLIGSASISGTKFIDTNIIPDFTETPPIHFVPFATNNQYPGTVQYYQQRLVYANSISNPDTYNMSRPGLYNNFDYSIPTIDSDSITGTPWGIQVNGIQWMVQTITGLLTFMGNGVWLVNGGAATAITSSNQNAQAQSQIGCSAILPPLQIGLHILYVQAKNSIVRDIAFNFLYNVFTGMDITVFSNHLFLGYTLSQWCYSEEPYKLIWAVRNDGILLSLTYIKEQEIEGWARHDTNGQFISVCSVIEPPDNEDVSYTIEPPIDAVYAIVKRYIVGEGSWAYYSERMNNRIWQNIEDCFCVDAGEFYPLTYPAATLTPAALDGTNNITGTNIINGGTRYTNPQAIAVDSSGVGLGATFSCAQVGGILTTCAPISNGQDYTLGLTSIIVTDPTGSGAVVDPIITNLVTFVASASVFSVGMIGDVLRVDGGKATITAISSGSTITANVTQAFTQSIPNDPNFLPVPSISGTWSISTPTTVVGGLNHLLGMTVTGLADGGVIVPTVVGPITVGSTTVIGIELQQAASAIVVGLLYTCQLQTMYLDQQEQTTMQGRRKDIFSIIPRIEASRGVQVGTNQPDASTQPNQVTVPWTGMKEIKERNNLVTAGSNIPLFTGDPDPIMVPGTWATNGQMAFQQVYPLPLNVIACIGFYSSGDNSA